MRLALFQPDIPQNTGTLLRMAACFAVPVDLIEPAGFQIGDARFRRALMDYGDRLDLTRHASWDTFQRDRGPGRLVLLTTKASRPVWEIDFQRNDVLLLGRLVVLQ